MKKASPGEAKPARKPRGRPRSFDREAALMAAMEVFWEKGFDGASVSELCAAMDLNPPSLYSAFGDKEKLFLEAADRYASQNRESCPYCDEPTARGAVEKLLTHAAHEFTESSEHPRGCLMLMASTTSGNGSEGLQKWIAQKRNAARENLRGRIKRGIEEGDVPAESRRHRAHGFLLHRPHRHGPAGARRGLAAQPPRNRRPGDVALPQAAKEETRGRRLIAQACFTGSAGDASSRGRYR
jgi:AcrR family transcriptional regulator